MKELYLFNFEIWYKYQDKTYSKIYTKFCKYPKKTRLYKNLIKQLNENKVFKIVIYNPI